MNLEKIPKIGSKSAELLNNLGIYNVDDLIRNYPYRFNVFSRRNINDERFYNEMVTDGMVESNPIVSFFKGKKNRLTFRCNVQNKIIKVVIYNRAFMKNSIKAGNYVTLIGKYDPSLETLTASNILLSKLPDKKVIIPVYHLCKGISLKQMRNFINNALSKCDINDNIPSKIKAKYGFMEEKRALEIIHNPTDETALKDALKTLKYEEIFTYMLKVRNLKIKNQEHNDLYRKMVDDGKVNLFIESLPFDLTLDQKKVIDEMITNIKSDVKMNRLLQGDVGSGKTIVAFVLAYAVFTAGYQSTLMAPTEILALQHYQNAVNLFKNTNFKIALLTGKTSSKEKKQIYDKLMNNEIDLLIGTHALISDKVFWNNLGLVITDEQHRFGVNQRLKLKNKSNYPDVLMMSATPIPRTYALTIYGDTDISSIKTMPKGRLPVKTYVRKTSELKDVLKRIYEALKNGNQAYVIAPMIEENEDTDYTNVYDLKHKFELAFKNYNIEILHGKMTKEEKDEVMDKYLENKVNILISTTVIEVGVDVKNASVMVIFDADRFGLSTLHQLRGRVGRNSVQSYCYLVSDKDKERLKIMEETSDGYKISEADFKLRGQGDLFGSKQSGALSFKLSDIKKDYDLFVKVKRDIENFMTD